MGKLSKNYSSQHIVIFYYSAAKAFLFHQALYRFRLTVARFHYKLSLFGKPLLPTAKDHTIKIETVLSAE